MLAEGQTPESLSAFVLGDYYHSNKRGADLFSGGNYENIGGTGRHILVEAKSLKSLTFKTLGRTQYACTYVHMHGKSSILKLKSA